MQDLLKIRWLFFTETLTSTSMGQASLQTPQPVQLSYFTGAILKIENRESKPEIVINGQKNLQ